MCYNSFVAQNNVFILRREVDSLSTETATATRREWLETQGYTPDEVELIIEYDGVFED